MLAGVGRNELASADVLRAVAPEAVDGPATSPSRPKVRHDHSRGQEGWFNLAKVMGLKFRMPTSSAEPAAEAPPASGAVPIRGIKNDIPVKFEEGGAVPGDRIVGVLMPGEGIRIFQIHSPKLAEFEHERWIDVTWDINAETPERFKAKIVVAVLNEPGTLAQIAQVIGEADGNIDNLHMRRSASDFTDMIIVVEVWDLEHLNRILAGIRAKAVVSRVERVFE